jgi:hypothetical protein
MWLLIYLVVNIAAVADFVYLEVTDPETFCMESYTCGWLSDWPQ